MRGWGIKVQVGRSWAWVQAWPFDWEYRTELMGPRLFGFGVWITKDLWADG